MKTNNIGQEYQKTNRVNQQNNKNNSNKNNIDIYIYKIKCENNIIKI